MESDEGDLFSDDDETTGSYMQGGAGAGLAGSDGNSGRHDRIIPSAADRRAHHNALERKRRDHIKDSFSSLRDSVPSLQGEKASRAQILKKAAEYIQFMRKKNNNCQTDIEEIRKQNKLLEEQIRLAERQNSASSTPIQQLSSSNLYSPSSLSILNNNSGSESGGLNGVVSPVSYGDMSENSNESGTSNDLAMINGAGQSGVNSGCGTVGINGRLLDSPVLTSNSNGGGSARSIINNSPTPISTTIRRHLPATPPLTTQQAQLLINGTSAATARSLKNGASTIIVQNPQIKSAIGGGQQPQVIHVSSTPSSTTTAANNSSSNNSNITATATPIIISTSALANQAVNSVGNTATIVTAPNGTGTAYTVNLNSKATAGQTASISLGPSANGTGTAPSFRTVVVQQPSTLSGNSGQQQQQPNTTTTPNIHIVSAIPTNYSGRNTTTTKRFKISTPNIAASTSINNNNNEQASTIIKSEPVETNNTSTSSTIFIDGAGTGNANSTSTAATQPTTFNVTSVSS